VSGPMNGNGWSAFWKMIAIGAIALVLSLGAAWGKWMVSRDNSQDVKFDQNRERIRLLEMRSVSIDERLATIQELLRYNKEDHENIKEKLEHLAELAR